MEKIVYLIIRLTLGISGLMHGVVGLLDYRLYTESLVTAFQHSFLPKDIVLAFGHALPFLEFVIGLFLIFGFFTKRIAIIGSFLMLLLLIGSTIIKDWDSYPSQFLHIAFYGLLIHFSASDYCAVDKLIKKPKVVNHSESDD